MKDQNRLRLSRIAERHAGRTPQKPSEPEPPREEEDDLAPAFLAAFARARDAVLRPAMAEVGLELKEVGYSFRIKPGGDERSPSVDLHVIIPDRGDSKDTVRFVARKDAARGWQVVGELELKGNPVELTRFETTEEISGDVIEQLVVDAVEQMLASTGGAPRGKPPALEPTVPASTPAPAPPPPVPMPPAPRTASTDAELSRPFVAPQSSEDAPPPVQPLKRPPAELFGTTTGSVMPTGPAVPFAPGSAPPQPSAPPPTAGPSATLPQVKRAPAALTGTSLGTLPPRGPAMPFAPGRPPGEAPAGTSGGVAIAAMPALPFDPNAPSHLPASGSPALPVRPPSKLSGTVDASAAPAGPQLPFAKAPEPPGPSGLSLEQYASLCVELALEPAKADETLLRYQLTSEQRKALDTHWQGRIAAEPSVWMRFDQAYAAYQKWCVASRKR
jgi:hypothetical protein